MNPATMNSSKMDTARLEIETIDLAPIDYATIDLATKGIAQLDSATIDRHKGVHTNGARNNRLLNYGHRTINKQQWTPQQITMELATIDSEKWTLDNGPRDTEPGTMASARIVSTTMSLVKIHFATMG